MGNSARCSQSFLLVCALLFSGAILSFSAVDSVGGWDLDELGWLSTMSPCRGTVGECFGGDEFEMESEISRRVLATRGRYISYGALQRNRIPCSRRGASYYNCRRGASANPYSRGCSAITRCRR
ncbi:protein RALF-like 33 [Malania oleifera]|uniref:protein RALF-like 33 n=1 Tax=Malania oleifera TaxID=397392 RepID=UPI0025AE9C7D|nr:protein RALF-like 33 [Malania oleifera]